MESNGVASGCICKAVYRFPHITYPYSSCICSFLQQHPYFLFIFNIEIRQIRLCRICMWRMWKDSIVHARLFNVHSDKLITRVIGVTRSCWITALHARKWSGFIHKIAQEVMIVWSYPD